MRLATIPTVHLAALVPAFATRVPIRGRLRRRVTCGPAREFGALSRPRRGDGLRSNQTTTTPVRRSVGACRPRARAVSRWTAAGRVPASRPSTWLPWPAADRQRADRLQTAEPLEPRWVAAGAWGQPERARSGRATRR